MPKLHPPSLREIDFPEHILNHSPRTLGSVSLSVSNILPMHQQGVLLRIGAMMQLTSQSHNLPDDCQCFFYNILFSCFQHHSFAPLLISLCVPSRASVCLVNIILSALIFIYLIFTVSLGTSNVSVAWVLIVSIFLNPKHIVVNKERVNVQTHYRVTNQRKPFTSLW